MNNVQYPPPLPPAAEGDSDSTPAAAEQQYYPPPGHPRYHYPRHPPPPAPHPQEHHGYNDAAYNHSAPPMHHYGGGAGYWAPAPPPTPHPYAAAGYHQYGQQHQHHPQHLGHPHPTPWPYPPPAASSAPDDASGERPRCKDRRIRPLPKPSSAPLAIGDKKSVHRKKKKMYSDFVGVTYNKTHSKYQACITHYRKQHYLGRYKLAVDAALAYDESARLLKGSSWKVRQRSCVVLLCLLGVQLPNMSNSFLRLYSSS